MRKAPAQVQNHLQGKGTLDKESTPLDVAVRPIPMSPGHGDMQAAMPGRRVQAARCSSLPARSPDRRVLHTLTELVP